MDQLQKQIDGLKNEIAALKYSSLIPREVETAFTERLALESKLSASGTGAAGNTGSYGAFPVTVPANPSGTLTVSYKGVTYNLLFK